MFPDGIGYGNVSMRNPRGPLRGAPSRSLRGDVHCARLWRSLAHRIPTTDESCAYGTPERSEAIRRLGQSELNDAGIIVLGGHEEGLLFYGLGESSALSQLYNAQRLLTQTARGAGWRFWNAGRRPTHHTQIEVNP